MKGLTAVRQRDGRRETAYQVRVSLANSVCWMTMRPFPGRWSGERRSRHNDSEEGAEGEILLEELVDMNKCSALLLAFSPSFASCGSH